MELYHVVTASTSVEIEVIKQVKPPRLLLSYYYFKNRPLERFISEIGYKPKIMLDSGAYSAFTKGKGIALTDYLKYVQDNREYIDLFISLDVIQDSDLSYWYWHIAREKGYKPIPVFHYLEDEKVLSKYANQTDYIALGGTVPEKDKNKVADWVRLIVAQYPEIKFHVLGTSSRKVIDTCAIASADSSTWIMQAIMGNPKHITGKSREAKVERAIYNLKGELELYASDILPAVNSGS